jgi:ATP phosphoribosyltransferase
MKLTIGLPNGSMQQATLALLSQIGIEIYPQGRSGLIDIEGLNLFSQAILMRPQDLALALLQKQIDCAICGLDWVIETELQQNIPIGSAIKRLKELPYSRAIKKSARIIVFGRPDSPPLQNPAIAISTEYTHLTKQAYPQATLSFSHGSTEIKVALGQYDYGVALTETGSSLRDNNLQIVDELLITPTLLIARESIPELMAFGDLLLGALEADRHQILKLNIDQKHKNQVINLLPALRAPTVSTLSDNAFAIETVVPKTHLAQLLIQLRTLGATDMVVQNLNAVVL